MFKEKFYKINENYAYDGLNKKIIVNNNRYCKLTEKEIAIIELLLLNKGSIVAKEMIIKSSSLFKEITDFGIRSIIAKLREKVGKDLIITIHYHGYVII